MKSVLPHRHLAALLISLAASPLALAEAPMTTDDAGTLPLGGKKLEATWAKDAKLQELSAAFAFSPIENLEIEGAAIGGRDRAESPATRNSGGALGVKWVPLQPEFGWALGMRADFGRTRVDLRSMNEKHSLEEASATGLATYRFEGGHAAHFNLGYARVREAGVSGNDRFWGAGFDYALRQDLHLTAEGFGVRGERPDHAAGIRWEVIEGVKLSGAIGRGSDRTFGQTTITWEF